MKITFVIQDISTQGGTERTTCCIANQFAIYGHDVSIVSFFKNQSQITYQVNDRIKCIFLNNDEYSLRLGLIQRCKKVLFQIKNIKNCKEIKDADVLIGQKVMASLLLFLSGFGHKTIACEHYRYKMYNAPIRGLRNILYNRLKGLITLTENDKDKFKKYVKRVEVIPNMITVTPYGNPNLNSKRIISAGRLTEQKGYDLLLTSLSYIKDKLTGWTVDIYGDGELKEPLERQKHELGLDSIVTFKGFTDDIAKEYEKSAFYVMSSRFEGFPLTLIEAAGCGLPIVSFACPEGPSTLLANGGGILAEAENCKELADAISTMANNQQLREQSSQESKIISENYKPEAIYKKWINTINAKFEIKARNL